LVLPKKQILEKKKENNLTIWILNDENNEYVNDDELEGTKKECEEKKNL
jgi:hypothetical protein